MNNNSILEKVKKVRAGLMDVSKSNRFINYKSRDKLGVEFKLDDIQSFYEELVLANKKVDITDMLADKTKDNPKLKETGKQGEQLMEEVGYNTLFISIGMLSWEDKEGDVNNSPLLFIPIEVLFAKDRAHLDYIMEDVFVNQSLVQALNGELGSEMPYEVEEIEDEQEYIYQDWMDLLTRYLDEVECKYKVDPSHCIIDVFNNDSFILYNDLKVENWGNDYFETHDLLNKVFQYGFSESVDNSIEELSIDKNPLMRRVKNVMSADSSQSRAVYHTLDGKNLLIEGPPGTGKSQTITNIIANNMRLGKTILFVSEKKAALDVVKRRLQSVGLGELCLELHSQKVNRETVIKEIENTYRAALVKASRNPELEPEIFKKKQEVNEYFDHLNKVDDKTGSTLAQAIEDFLYFDNLYEDLPKVDFKGDITAQKGFNELLTFVKELQQFINELGTPSESKFYGVGIVSLPKAKNDAAVATVNEVIDHLKFYTEHFSEDINLLALKLDDLSNLESAINDLDAMPVQSFTLTDELETELGNVKKQLKALQKAKSSFEKEGFNEKIYSLTDSQIEDANRYISACELAEKNKTVETKPLMEDIEKLAEKVYSQKIKASKVPQWKKVLNTIIDTNKQITEYNSIKATLTSLGFEVVDNAFDFNFEDAIATIDTVERVQKSLKKIKITNLPSVINEHKEKGERYQALEKVVSEYKEISKKVLEIDNTLLFKTPYHTRKISELVEGFAYFKENWEDLHKLFKFNEYRALIEKKGLNALIDPIETEDMTGQKIVDCFLRDRNRKVIDHILKQDPYFKKFSSIQFNTDIKKLIDDFAYMSEFANREEIIENYVKKVHKLKFESYGNLTQDTQMSFLRNEFSKKRPRKLRSFLSSTYKPLQIIKPVFLMSPLSVAKFLEPKIYNFDMVVYDEASQLKPDDVLGTILRSKQLVVVGDSQQLPPTSFFNSVINDDMNDEFNLNEYESLIKLLKGKGINTVSLDWHYRSEHETLIKFSNDYFYHDRLIYFPSSVQDSIDYGLKYNYVEGEYEKGGSRANLLEAMELVSKMIEDIERNPHVTIGIVALSLAQCAAIEEEILIQAKENKILRDYMAAASKTGEDLFIKNLEAVQGDERDVIYISIAYGVMENGKLSKNFGAINRKGGERRLNVLITRARLRTEIFTNMHASDITIDDTTTEGIKVLRSILQYAEFGGEENQLMKKDETKPHSFIGHLLEQKGYTVDYKVGRHDFFIDVAVRSKQDPTKYAIGIEYDHTLGMTVDNINDRDNTRPSVLKSKGWNLYRLYSIDAFDNQESVINDIIKIIDKGPKKAAAGAKVPEVKRVDSGMQSVEDGDIDQYEKYSEVIAPIGDPANITAIKELLFNIIKQEAPINNEVINMRVQELKAFPALKPEVKQGIFTALYNLENEGKVTYHNGFYYIEGKEIIFRDRRKTSGNAVTLSGISQKELRVGVIDIVNNSFGVTFEGILSLLNKFFNTPKTDIKERFIVEKIVNNLVMEKKIQIDKSSYYIPVVVEE